MLAGDLLLSCYMESSPGFVPHIKTAAGRYCSGEGMGAAAGGVPTVPIALSGGRRDEGHQIRLLQGLVAPVISFFCPNLTHLPHQQGFAALGWHPSGWRGDREHPAIVPMGSAIVPVGPASFPRGTVTIPMGPVTIPLSPAIIPVGFAGVCHHPHGSYWRPQESYIIPMGPVIISTGPAMVPMGPVIIPTGPAMVPMGPADLSISPPGAPMGHSGVPMSQQGRASLLHLLPQVWGCGCC